MYHRELSYISHNNNLASLIANVCLFVCVWETRARERDRWWRCVCPLIFAIKWVILLRLVDFFLSSRKNNTREIFATGANSRDAFLWIAINYELNMSRKKTTTLESRKKGVKKFQPDLRQWFDIPYQIKTITMPARWWLRQDKQTATHVLYIPRKCEHFHVDEGSISNHKKSCMVS